MSITFRPEIHQYLIDGKIAPSVTQVLKAAGVCGSGSFYTEGAASRGTAVHLATQLIDEGYCTPDEYSASEISGYVQAWENFKARTGFKFDQIEVRVGSPFFMVAGTADRVGRVGIHGYTLDIKTGAPADWHRLQLACYNILMGRENLGRMAVYIKNDGTFRVKNFDSPVDYLQAREILKKFGGLAA